MPSLIFFYLHTTIRPNYMVLFHLFFLQCTTIYGYFGIEFINFTFKGKLRPKIRVLINLFFLFVHDHSTKVRGHSYSLIYSFLIVSIFRLHYCLYISSTIFYIHGTAALIFRTLYPWLYDALPGELYKRAKRKINAFRCTLWST